MADIGNKNTGVRYQVDVPSLEADIAFFKARVSLVGDNPHTLNQSAQLKAFEALGGHMSSMLKALQRNHNNKKSAK